MDFGSPQKICLYVNLKKCYFHQDKIRFLGFVIFTDRIQIEEKRIKIVKKWLEPKLVQDI